jgi:hypothetical protein
MPLRATTRAAPQTRGAIVTEFQPLASYGPAVDQLLRDAPGMAVGAARPQSPAAGASLEQVLAPGQLFGGRDVADGDMAQCCRSALWLRFGFLDQSHEISQSIGTPEGSYWHGIMHRHEPDYSNAKYWFRRVGRHPVFAQLGPLAREAIGRSGASLDFAREGSWDPLQFVDVCQQHASGGDARDQVRKLIELEWSVLFDACYRQASGEASSSE